MSTPTTSWVEEARREAARQKAPATKAASSTNVAHRAFDGSIVAFLLIAAALTHGPVFGGASGYVASLGGVLIGGLAALATTALRTRTIGSLLTVMAAYLAFGGALAIPSTTAFHVVPTLSTLQMLVVGVVTSWKDLLTVQPPAGVFVGPAIMPFLSSLLMAFAALTIALRTRRQPWSLLPVATLLLLGILWGSQMAPLALPVGTFIAVLALTWAGALAARQRREGASGVVEFRGAGTRPVFRRRLGAALMVVLAAAAAVPATSHLTAGGHRTVIRDYVEPPLDLREYHSPATQFRTLNTTDKDTALFTVTGLPKGTRVRLATLDMYDGTVAQIAGDARGAGFRHVGTVFTDQPLAPGLEVAQVNVEILDYTGNWIPGGGNLRSLTYTSKRADELSRALFYSDLLGTALSTTRLTQGDTYTVTQVIERQWSDQELEGRAFMQVPMPTDTAVPNVVAEVASALTAEAAPGIGQVRALQQQLHDEGFYSDGSDMLSLPGHRTSRIEEFLTQDQLIGDDDQYAVSMALMLRALGIPSRVVMGFYPEIPADGTVTLTGKDTHLWVEVPFEGAGWVAFDPTPPRDQVPQTEVPKPKPNPKPQVLQPPEPPEEPAELPPDNLEDTDEDETGRPAWIAILITILTWTGIGILALSPLWLLLLIKILRRRRRRTAGTTDKQTAAAWEEVIDHAIDLGLFVPTRSTRWDQAMRIEAHLDRRDPSTVTDSGFHPWNEPRSPMAAMASTLDSVVFSHAPANEAHKEWAWNARKEVIAAINAKSPWYRRLVAPLSTRSLRLRRTKLRDRISRALKARSKNKAVTATAEDGAFVLDEPQGKGRSR